jgi:hypothetical protein
LNNLSIGTIVQIPLFTIKFTLHAKDNVIISVKTALDIQRFNVITLKQQIYGHPKPIGSSAAFGNIAGKKLPASFIQTYQRPPSLISTTSASASPFRVLKPTGALGDKSPSLQVDQKSVRKFSKELVSPLGEVAQYQEDDDLPLTPFLADEPVSSIEMNPVSERGAFSAKLFTNWQV